MFSVTSTGKNFWPLYTPKVRPTNCGRMVDRRDQILMISLRPEPRAVSAFFKRNPSTNAPFQTERAIGRRSEEHTPELQPLMRISYAVFSLKKTTQKKITTPEIT